MPRNATDNHSTGAGPPSEEAFALVGNEIRAEIIQVLGACGELPFAELRAQMDTEVDPSQLHYHLQQLVGHFVEKTDSGYRLHAVGLRLCHTLRAGTFDRRQEHMAAETDFDCYFCGAPVEAIFDSGTGRIICSDCGHGYLTDLLDIPLEEFENATAAFSHFSTHMGLKNLHLDRGVCTSCTNPLDLEFHSFEEHPGPHKVSVFRSCDLCGATAYQSVGMALLSDPGLRSFGHDHGVDVLSIPYWELEFVATDNYVNVRSTDPWEVALEVTFDDDTLELVVDGDLNVIERNHLDTTDVDEIVLPDKDDCLQDLRRHRWPGDVTCPDCNSPDTTKMGTTSKDVQRYRCHNCGITFNDLTGTVFADHQLTLPEMFHIIREMDETEMTKIARQLDRSYPAIVDFVHEVQDAADEESDSNLSAVHDADELV